MTEVNTVPTLLPSLQHKASRGWRLEAGGQDQEPFYKYKGWK